MERSTIGVILSDKEDLKGLVDLSNDEYHSNKTHFSSTQLKTLLDSPEKFHNDYILGKKESNSDAPQFIEGSYAHSMILEPDKIDDEYAFFDGFRKAGKEWIRFKNDPNNQKKQIVSKAQKHRVHKMYEGFLELPEASEILKDCEVEQSLFTNIYKIPIKVRCDAINVDKGYLVDVKTSSFPIDVDSFKLTIDRYKYQLSAALYCMAFEKYYKKPFDFYFIVLGKKDFDCQVYKLSKRSLEEGKGMVVEAINVYKRCKESENWKLDQKNDIIIDGDYEILEV